ncbi:CDP-glycerol glycerophosphotransferase family protein [Polaribacter tangerinus]|uniref:CDP-glycerol glycerophosphotransferase family protein n=1 Tax=Polaribacter tangerinus TaxID=1920034 RepID=UPI000B4AC6A9|nr:CDP-glycerol glycerophosphotransferase family protein [Polaribacter tangerinus]
MIHLFIIIIRFFFKPNKKFIIYHSFPNFSDNCFAFFCYVINNHKQYKNIWFITGSNREKYNQLITNYTTSSNYVIVKKKSILGVYYFCKSKYIFFTHGLFNEISLSTKQINVNLWHGMPLKNIGYLDQNNRVPKSNFVIATSKLFQKIMSQAFLIKNDNVLITGQPRNDFILEKNFSLYNLTGEEKINFNKTVLWMPTYRKSKIGDLRKDGAEDQMNDFFEEIFLIKLNEFFKSINSKCFIKIHPMDYLGITDFKTFSNLTFLNNDSFEQKGISLYSVLQNTDLLLTDFSSIYIDYLLLNKPIGFIISDFEQYSNSRGFVFDNPKKYMPGEIISSKKELIFFLQKTLLEQEDDFSEIRKNIRDIFHSFENNFSEKVFNTIFK